MPFTKEQIAMHLSTNPKWAERALLRLLDRQTSTEQASDATINRNGMGFTPGDAFMYTKLAQWVKAGKHLTPNQLAYLGIDSPCRTRTLKTYRDRPSIAKYAGQMLKVIEEDQKSS